MISLEKTDEEWECDLHIHDECEISLILQKGISYILNDRKYELNEGDIIFINEKIPHSAIVNKGTECLIIQFRINSYMKNVHEILYQYINNASKDAAYFKSGTEECKKLKECLYNIITETNLKSNAFEDFIIAEIYKMIAILYRYEIIKNPEQFFAIESIERLIPVFDYIHNNYSENISLEKMSKLINVDKSHFCRLFKKTVNTTLLNYINFVRISYSEKLLLTTDLGITEISEIVGFASGAYFTKIFKRIKGCTPMQYRKYKTV